MMLRLERVLGQALDMQAQAKRRIVTRQQPPTLTMPNMRLLLIVTSLPTLTWPTLLW